MAEKINKISSQNNNTISISGIKIQLSNNLPLDNTLFENITKLRQKAKNIETSLTNEKNSPQILSEINDKIQNFQTKKPKPITKT